VLEHHRSGEPEDAPIRLEVLDNSSVRYKNRTWDASNEIVTFLRGQEVAHVAVYDEPYPYVLPQTYQIEVSKDGTLTFLLHFGRAGRLGRLVRANPKLTIVVDEVMALLAGPAADESSLEYRSVLARCDAELSDDLDVLEAHQYQVLEKYRPKRDFADMTAAGSNR